MGKGGPKRNDIERERDLAILSGLYVQGMQEWQMAEIISSQYDFTLSTRTIRNDKAELRKRWIESQLFNFDEAKARELELIDAAIAACWLGWNNSLRDEGYEITIEATDQKLAGGEGDKPIDLDKYKKTVRRAMRDGSVIWIEEIRKLSDQRSRILGLYEPEKFQVDWRTRMKEAGMDDKTADTVLEQALEVVEKHWKDTDPILDQYQDDIE